jgi:hypothetical protein
LQRDHSSRLYHYIPCSCPLAVALPAFASSQ